MSQMRIRILGISIYVNARDAKTVSSFKYITNEHIFNSL